MRTLHGFYQKSFLSLLFPLLCACSANYGFVIGSSGSGGGNPSADSQSVPTPRPPTTGGTVSTPTPPTQGGGSATPPSGGDVSVPDPGSTTPPPPETPPSGNPPTDPGSSNPPPPPPSGDHNPPCNHPPDTNPPPSTSGQCQIKVLVHVVGIEIALGDDIHFANVSITPGVIDLCELSKDFLGISILRLKANWPMGTKIRQIRFILEDDDGDRVEKDTGEKICDLRVPPGSSSGLHFSAKPEVEISQKGKITYAFSSEDAYHWIGGNGCQLKPAVGQYRIDQ